MFTDITGVVVELLHIQLPGFGCIREAESHSFFLAMYTIYIYFYNCIEIGCKHEVGE